jgi:hypothetical protein
MTRYKFMLDGFKSAHGNHTWEIGKWCKTDGDLELCQKGFHCSKGIYQAFSYVQGSILTKVEVRGKHLDEKDKEVWEEMRVTKAWKWTKKDSVLFSIYAARLVLDIYEKQYPDDDRSRKAIEAAETYIKNPTEENKAAARAAARAAYAAAYAADAAAYAGRATAYAADAAYAAAYAGRAAAYAGRAAGRAAANAAVYKKLDKWMNKHLTELEEIK